MPIQRQIGQHESDSKRAASRRGPVFPYLPGYPRGRVAATFTNNLAPWIEPPSLASAGEVVGFAFATGNEIALADEATLAAETALADELAFAGNPAMLFVPYWRTSARARGKPHRDICPA